MYRSYDHVPNSHNLPAEVDFNQLHIYQKLKGMIVMIASGTQRTAFNRICTSGGEQRLQEVTPHLLCSTLLFAPSLLYMHLEHQAPKLEGLICRCTGVTDLNVMKLKPSC